MITDVSITLNFIQVGFKMIYTIQKVNGELVIITEENEILPLSVLDNHRLINENGRIGNQVGIRFWDKKWDMWTFSIVSLVEGSDVSIFFNF